jgi:hypothetical protein
MTKRISQKHPEILKSTMHRSGVMELNIPSLHYSTTPSFHAVFTLPLGRLLF